VDLALSGRGDGIERDPNFALVNMEALSIYLSSYMLAK
jgi:hypothetical protein